uniref:Uncharacterized protein n=1 Tax=Melanopsichium pennsylvanicum 4 TaxID=1398559 RepID=A0A077QZF9_9BASI|nr:uncharacterized protein BN887_06047 [Melanopsichium pennsylvanicum 4]
MYGMLSSRIRPTGTLHASFIETDRQLVLRCGLTGRFRLGGAGVFQQTRSIGSAGWWKKRYVIGVVRQQALNVRDEIDVLVPRHSSRASLSHANHALDAVCQDHICETIKAQTSRFSLDPKLDTPLAVASTDAGIRMKSYSKWK